MNIGDRVQTLNTFVPITGEIVDMYKNRVTIADDDIDFVAPKKTKIGKQDEVSVRLIYVTKFPHLSSHKFHHLGQAAGIIEPLDERVREHIKKLVRKLLKLWKKLEKME